MDHKLEYLILRNRNVGEETIKMLNKMDAKHPGTSTLFYLQLNAEQLVKISYVRMYIRELCNLDCETPLIPTRRIKQMLNKKQLAGYDFKGRAWVTKASIIKAISDGLIRIR